MEAAVNTVLVLGIVVYVSHSCSLPLQSISWMVVSEKQHTWESMVCLVSTGIWVVEVVIVDAQA